jgi:hypothetical protein
MIPYDFHLLLVLEALPVECQAASQINMRGRHVVLDNYNECLWRFNLMLVPNHSFLTADEIAMNVEYIISIISTWTLNVILLSRIISAVFFCLTK